MAALQESFRDNSTEFRVRLHIPKTIARFGTQQAADFLLGGLQDENDGMVRFKLLTGLANIVTKHRFKVEQKLVFSALRGNLLEWLRLLALCGPLVTPDDTCLPEGRAGEPPSLFLCQS